MNKKLVQISDFEADDKEDIMDIVHSVRRKVGGKIIHVNVSPAHMDNVLFHCETSVQKWKYVFQRRITSERGLGK